MTPELDKHSPTARIQVVATESWLDRLDQWRRSQKKIPSRSAAIRLLVEAALEMAVKKKGR